MAVAALATVLVTGPSRAASTTTVPTAVEAWYHGSASAPASTPASGDAPAASPYAAGTLHVGVTAGVESARTYLRLDPAALGDETVEASQLVLPLDAGDGTTAPETARLAVCFAPDPGPAADGSLAAPPPVDCSHAVDAVFMPTPTPRFVADLAPIGYDVAIRSGGLALLPADAARTGSATWHVAFHGRASAPSPADAIHAEVTLEPAASAAARDVETVAGVPALGPTEDRTPAVEARPAFVDTPAAELFPATPAAAPSVLGSTAAGGVITARPAGLMRDEGFAYSGVLVLPLVLLAGIAIVASALTRDPVVTAATVVDDDNDG